jgi:hypothetical protein
MSRDEWRSSDLAFFWGGSMPRMSKDSDKEVLSVNTVVDQYRTNIGFELEDSGISVEESWTGAGLLLALAGITSLAGTYVLIAAAV